VSEQHDSERLARAFKALSNPNRLKIYQSFAEYWDRQGSAAPLAQGCLLTQAVQRLSIGAPTVSHHIRELADAGLISTERRGRQLFCAIDPGMRERLKDFFAAGTGGL